MINKRYLSSCSNKDIDLPEGVVLISKIKNEYSRLSFFIQYYRLIGVKSFIFIDNCSSDNSYEFLDNKENIHVFSTDEPLDNEAAWIKNILDSFCINRWVLVVDADELFCYKDFERININQLTNYLDSKKENAVEALLLDMYPSGLLSKVRINEFYSPLSSVHFFDKSSHYRKYNKYYGGVRKRVFNVEPCLTKYPLFKYTTGMTISAGMHSLKNTSGSSLNTALLHCKFTPEFQSKVNDAVSSKLHWNSSQEYFGYKKILDNQADLSLYDKMVSVEYINSHSLIQSSIINTPQDYLLYLNKFKQPKVSLVLCSYGTDTLAPTLIDSINNQSFQDFEVIIVDNNKVKKVDLPCLKRDCIVVHESQEGLSNARNKGAVTSRGEYILFLDTDVILDKSCIESLVKGIEIYGSDIVGGQVRLREELVMGLTKRERRFLSELIYESNIEYLQFPKYIIGACMMFRRTVFIKYGFFMNNLGRVGNNLLSGEETEMIKRVLKYSGKISYIHNAICIHDISLKRKKFSYLIKRSFWQGITDFKIDNLLDETFSREFRIIDNNFKDTLLNISRLFGYYVMYIF